MVDDILGADHLELIDNPLQDFDILTVLSYSWKQEELS